MKIVTNEKLIIRNRRIGQYLSIASLAVLAVGLYISFQPTMVSLSFLALIIGFMLSQIGIFYGNRWGRSPRPDEVITAALKGLDNRFTLYHYTTPVSHLLVGPVGAWVLLPFSQRGTITYEKNRWRQKGGNLYLKIFAQEGLGRPDQEVKTATMDMTRFFEKLPEGANLPPVQAALVFTNLKATVQAPDAPVPTMTADKLKDFIRGKMRNKADLLTPTQIKMYEDILPGGQVVELKED